MAAGRVSGFNQENGKMIVFVSELYSMPATLCSQVHKIRANIKSGLDSNTQKLGVTNHGQILQENSLTQLVDPLAQEKVILES